MKREFDVPAELSAGIKKLLSEMGWWGRWQELARAVLDLSDHFHSNKSVTPWNDPRLQAAYLAYFLPLNFVRMSAVLREAELQGLPVTNEIVDIGSGPGTASLAWSRAGSSPKWIHWELSSRAQEIHRELLTSMGVASDNHHWVSTAPQFKKRVVVASYALNEMGQWPEGILDATALILVEPSTQVAARRLMAYRRTLMDKGFHLWAPCTHQMDCPLLINSKTDWCHDRIHFIAPEWWSELESRLPMRNQTLTFSYLLASREAPNRLPADARIIGDTLRQRGKWRQAVCRNDKREFLSWLTRYGEPEVIPHGSMIQLPDNLEVKGNNELRVQPPNSSDKN